MSGGAQPGAGDLLSEKEAAAALALSASTLRNWRCKNQGPKAVRVGTRSIRYRRADLEAFIADGEGGA